MKNLIVLAVAALFATNAVAAEMKWTGSAGWRYAQQSINDNLDSKDNPSTNKDVSTEKTRMHQMRANLGVMGGWENVEYGFGVRTGGAGTRNSDWATMTNGGDQGIGIEQAWFRYVRDFGGVDLAATIGRQKLALATDTTWQTLFDNDHRFDGFGWNFKFGMFGFNAAQYVLGAVSQGATGASTYTYNESTDNIATTTRRFNMLWAFQPHMTWKFSDEIEAMFAVAYYKWNSSGYTNTIGPNRTIANAGTIPAIAGSTYNMDNKDHWDFLVNVALPFNLAFTGNYVKSSKAAYNTATVAAYNGQNNLTTPGSGNRTPDVSSTAWTAGLTYGKLRKAQDFTLGYAYGSKGIGSVISAYSNDLFPADYKGHTVIAGYSLADNFHLGFRWISRKEKEKIAVGTQTYANGAGLPYGASAAGVAGRNANQEQKVNYWELTAGVAF